MHETLIRPLAELDIEVVFVDGMFFRQHCVLNGLSANSQAARQELGLREDSTESAPVVRALLVDLVSPQVGDRALGRIGKTTHRSALLAK